MAVQYQMLSYVNNRKHYKTENVFCRSLIGSHIWLIE